MSACRPQLTGRTRHLAALAIVVGMALAGCAGPTTDVAPTTTPNSVPFGSTPPVTEPTTIPSAAPTAAPSTAPTTVDSAPPSTTPAIEPAADVFFPVEPGLGEIELDVESADTPAGPVVHVLSADIDGDELRVFHGAFIPAGDPDGSPRQCTGTSRAEGTTWICGQGTPNFGERFSYSVDSGDYVITIEGVPADAVAVDIVATNGFRIRTEPIDGYAVLAGSRADGNPRELVAHLATGETVTATVLLRG